MIDDGGCTDETIPRARSKGAEVLTRPTGVGPLGWIFNQKALLATWEAQGITHILTIDAGWTQDPALLPKFLDAAAATDADVVAAARQFYFRPRTRTLISWLAAKLYGVPDATCGYRLYTLAALESLPQLNNRTGFTFHFVVLALLRRGGLKVTWVEHPYEFLGKSSFKWATLRDALQAAVELALGRVPTC